MSIRIKMLLPIVLLLVVLSATLKLYWLPSFVAEETATMHGQEVVYLDMLGTALVPHVLAGDMSKVEALLGRALASHPAWRTIVLNDDAGHRLYPEVLPAGGPGSQQEWFTHKIIQHSRALAEIKVDFKSDFMAAQTKKAAGYLEHIVWAVLLGGLLFSTMLVELLVRRPLRQLSEATHLLARGDFAVELPSSGSDDEIGQLVRDFGAMQAELQKREMALNHQVRLSEAVSSIQAHFISEHDSFAELNSVLDRFLQITACEMGLIGEYYLDAQGQASLRLLASAELPADLDVPGKEGLLDLLAAASGQPLIINDLHAQNQGLHLSFFQANMHSCLTVPLSSFGALNGVIILFNRPGGFPPQLYEEYRTLFQALANLLNANQTNRSLQENEQRMRAVLDNAVEAIITISDTGLVESFNLAAEDMFGYRAGEIIGSKINQLMPARHGSRHDEYIKSYDDTGISKVIGIGREFEGKRKDGTLFPLELSVSEIILPGRRLFSGIIRDISERQKIEAALKQERDFSNAIVDSAGSIIVIMDRKGAIVRINKSAERLTGYKEVDVVGKYVWDIFVPEEEREDVLRVFADLQAGMFPNEHENYWLTKDGQKVLLAWVNACIVDQDNEVEHVIAIGVDITERDLLQRAIAKTKESLDQAQAVANLGNWDWDIDNNTLWWSDGIYRIFGLSPQEFEATYEAFLQAVHPDDREKVQVGVSEALADKKPYDLDHRIMQPDGKVCMVHEQAIITRDPDGTPIRMVGTVQDITRISETQQRLEETYRQLSDYIDVVDHNVLTSSTDPKGIITYASAAFCQKSGYEVEEMLGKAHNIVRHPETPKELYAEMWHTIKAGKVWRGELKNCRKDGSSYWVDMSITPNFDESQQITGYTAIRQDITDKKYIEEISITDALTGLYNRRHFNTVLSQELRRARRSGINLVFVMFDVDNFKQYNDLYGHQKGDEVLELLGKTLKKALQRASDFAFRLGGEEFGILLGDMSEAEAVAFCEEYRKHLENQKVEHKKNSAGPYLTISLGLMVIPAASNASVDDIYKKTDDALYRAKDAGRNRLEVA